MRRRCAFAALFRPTCGTRNLRQRLKTQFALRRWYLGVGPKADESYLHFNTLALFSTTGRNKAFLHNNAEGGGNGHK